MTIASTTRSTGSKFTRVMPGSLDVLDLVRAAVVLALAVTASTHEGRARQIPDVLTVPGIGLGLALAVLDGTGAHTVLALLLGVVLALAMFARSGPGSGAATLWVALAACAGLRATVIASVGVILIVPALTALHRRVYAGSSRAHAPLFLGSRIALVAMTIGLVLDLVLQARDAG